MTILNMAGRTLGMIVSIISAALALMPLSRAAQIKVSSVVHA